MLELNKVYLGNCLELMKDIQDASIDLTVTSPPYDNLRTYNGYAFDFEGIAVELFRITKTGGIVVWVVGDSTVNGSETGTSFRQALHFKDVGFNIHDTMIYQKMGCSMPSRNRYLSNFEYMFVFSKGKPVTYNLISDRKNRFTTRWEKDEKFVIKMVRGHTEKSIKPRSLDDDLTSGNTIMVVKGTAIQMNMHINILQHFPND